MDLKFEECLSCRRVIIKQRCERRLESYLEGATDLRDAERSDEKTTWSARGQYVAGITNGETIVDGGDQRNSRDNGLFRNEQSSWSWIAKCSS